MNNFLLFDRHTKVVYALFCKWTAKSFSYRARTNGHRPPQIRCHPVFLVCVTLNGGINTLPSASIYCPVVLLHPSLYFQLNETKNVENNTTLFPFSGCIFYLPALILYYVITKKKEIMSVDVIAMQWCNRYLIKYLPISWEYHWNKSLFYTLAASIGLLHTFRNNLITWTINVMIYSSNYFEKLIAERESCTSISE